MILSLCVQFTRLPVMNSRLGTIMLWLSPLMIVVARMLIRSTLPVIAGDGDDVADADRPLQQQDDAADEVRDDLLEAEPQADAERGQDHADPLMPRWTAESPASRPTPSTA